MNRRVPESAFHAAALFFLWAYPFAKFLLHNEHPFLRLPVMAFFALFAAGAVLIARIAAHPIPRALVYGASFLVLITATGSRMPSRRLLLSILLSLAVAVALAWRPRLLRPVAAIFIAGCLLSEAALAVQSLGRGAARSGLPSAHASPGAADPGPAPDGPPSHVVHLILDEHIGVAGLPADLPGLGTMKSRLESFYTSRGFDLWTHAYSHYASSQDAIPSILNGRLVEQAGGFFEGMKTRNLRENRLFDIYQGRGLALSVYQSRYINYCAHPSTGGCFQYNDNAIGSLEGAPLDDWEKAWVIGSHYLGTNAMWRTWGRRAPGRDRLRMKVGPLSTFPSTLERLERDILAARESTAFFAHLHMPHSPYVYDASCRVRPVSEWLQHNSGSYTDRYQRYGDQVECLLSRMDDLLDSLKAAGLLERTTIVLHGDHGSRITRRKPHEQDPVDLLSLHSTLVAIRSPGAAQGRRIDDVRSVTEILWKEVARQEPALQAGAAPAIYRRRAPHERELISMPLPPIW